MLILYSIKHNHNIWKTLIVHPTAHLYIIITSLFLKLGNFRCSYHFKLKCPYILKGIDLKDKCLRFHLLQVHLVRKVEFLGTKCLSQYLRCILFMLRYKPTSWQYPTLKSYLTTFISKFLVSQDASKPIQVTNPISYIMV